MSNRNAVGIIFPNVHDANVPELVTRRTMASIPFAGRYRLIDFGLSGMARAGITNVGVIVRQNYQSLLDHLGSGREWDLSRKRGGLVIFPPYVQRPENGDYAGRVEGLGTVLGYLDKQKEDYVVLDDCDIACNIDYRDLLNRHIDSGADVTTVYNRTEITNGLVNANTCYKFSSSGTVREIRFNEYKKGPQNVSMHVFVVGREHLISMVKEAQVRGDTKLERDVFAGYLPGLRMMGYEYNGYCARICDMKSYFDENLRLLERKNLEALFPENMPVYTKVRDEAPVRYAMGATVRGSVVADGCIIEGDVECCMLFRGVHVGKGAKVKNCVIMQGSDIRDGAELTNVIADKNVIVGEGQVLRGAESFPVFVGKDSRVGAG